MSSSLKVFQYGSNIVKYSNISQIFIRPPLIINNISLHVDLLLLKKSWDKAKEMSDQPTIEHSKEGRLCV